MLRELRINSLALIDSLHIEFGDGLSVLTGETGAGKSIILQAIHLLSGGKASASWIRNGADRAVVEALFDIGPLRTDIHAQLAEMGFDHDGDLTIKRVVAASGKSRFYINGSLATARLAGEISEGLLSVASQHDHQQLLATRYHLDILDALGDLDGQRQELADRYGHWSQLRTQYLELQQQERDKEQRRDFLAYQCREIDEAELDPDEEEALVQEKERLRAADTLLRLGHECSHLLNETVADAMAQIRKNLDQMASHDQGLTGLAEAVSGHGFELEDQAAELNRYLDGLSNDPTRLEAVTARIDLLQQLKRKYGETVADVIAHGEQAARELSQLDAMDQRLETLAKEVDEAGSAAEKLAEKLSRARRQVADSLAAAVATELGSLSFEQSRFEVRFADQPEEHSLDTLSANGWDRPQFMFSANPGEPVKPLAKIASGGELSRLTLALKCLLARKDRVATVIFDEVDAGISGKAAEAVALKIKELGGHHQVLCITHLPPIAATATEHFTVRKAVTDNTTRTSITRLSPADRVQELARMLAGDSVTDKTLDYARELIDKNSGECPV